MSKLILPVIVLALFAPSVCLNAQQEETRVQQAADRFIKRFRQTLDFGTVFDEMFVRDAIRRLRKAGFFKGMNLSSQLIESLEDPELERAYKALMNYYYLRAVYDIGVAKDDHPPPDVEAVVRNSKFFKLLSDDGGGDFTIANRQEFDDYVTEMTNLAALYKRHLTPKIFDSAAYKAQVRELLKPDSKLQITNGLEDLGVDEGTMVYRLDKDIFQFFFIEETGRLRVLNLGLGN